MAKNHECVKCGKEIIPCEGYYNYSSGPECAKCGGGEKLDPIAALRFTIKMAKMQLGCAPSAGYMEELILEARKALNIKTGNR